MSDIVKAIRRLIEEINSGYATSEDYVEAAHNIGHLGQQLLSGIEASTPAENFSAKLKDLIRKAKVAAGSWAPPQALADMSAAAFDLAISLKALRDLLEAAEGSHRSLGGAMKNVSFGTVKEKAAKPRSPFGDGGSTEDSHRGLARSQSHSQLDSMPKNGSNYARSISSTALSEVENGTSAGDSMTETLVSALSHLALCVKILSGPNHPASAADSVKEAAQALAKTTKALISAAIEYSVSEPISYLIYLFFNCNSFLPTQNQIEMNGRREIFNNEISDLLQKKEQGSNGPAFAKIASDEYPIVTVDLPFLPANEAMTDEDFRTLMDDNLRDLVLGKDAGSDIPTIKAGSFDQLVRRLIFYKYPDPDFTEAFLLTYHSFTSNPVDLLIRVLALYNESPPRNLSKEQFDTFYKTKVIPTRLRVINVFKSWIDKHYEDFENDEQLEQMLLDFLTNNKTHHYYQQNSESPSLSLSISSTPQGLPS